MDGPVKHLRKCGEEVFIFLNAVEEHKNGKFYPLFLTLLRTGMRIGEALGLKWQDIDFEKRQIEIQRHVVRGKVLPGTKMGKTE